MPCLTQGIYGNLHSISTIQRVRKNTNNSMSTPTRTRTLSQKIGIGAILVLE